MHPRGAQHQPSWPLRDFLSQLRAPLRSLAKPDEGEAEKWLQIEMSILLKRILSGAK